MASYNKFEDFVNQVYQGTHNVDGGGHTLNVYLSNEVPSASAYTIKTDLAEITNENGYAAPVDTQQTWAEASGTGTLTGSKVTITASGGTVGAFQYVVLYNDSPTSPLDPLIAWWDYGTSITLANGEQFIIKFNNGDPTGTIFTAT